MKLRKCLPMLPTLCMFAGMLPTALSDAVEEVDLADDGKELA